METRPELPKVRLRRSPLALRRGTQHTASIPVVAATVTLVVIAVWGPSLFDEEPLDAVFLHVEAVVKPGIPMVRRHEVWRDERGRVGDRFPGASVGVYALSVTGRDPPNGKARVKGRVTLLLPSSKLLDRASRLLGRGNRLEQVDFEADSVDIRDGLARFERAPVSGR